MRGRSLTVGIALAAVWVFCVSASLQFAQSPEWYKYGIDPRHQASAVFDSSSDIMVVFGGRHGQNIHLNDVWWALNLVNATCEPPGSSDTNCDLQWSEPASGSLTNPPVPRYGHTAVYDSVNIRMIVFAGASGFPSPCLNDVHVLEYATGIGGTAAWATLSPTGTLPAARYSHTAVYNSSSNDMIVFGGNNCSTTSFNDVWVLSNANGLGGTATWSQLSPTGTAPAARSLSSAVYDETNNRMIVFGGTNASGTLLNDVWVLTNANGLTGTPAWVQLSPTGTAPAPRDGQTAVYDATNNLMIMYGGATSSTTQVGDTWVLTNANGLGGTPAWTNTVPGGGSSPSRSLQSAVYDPTSNKMFIFGGLFSLNPNIEDDHIYVLDNASDGL